MVRFTIFGFLYNKIHSVVTTGFPYSKKEKKDVFTGIFLVNQDEPN